LACTPTRAYEALTAEIPQWWTEQYLGRASTQRDRFTVRFGESVFKTMEVAALKTGERVIWQVVDSRMDLPQLARKSEWSGTTILWDIHHKGTGTCITLTHRGLNPNIACHAICRAGWDQFTGSLVDHLLWGKGRPFKAVV